MDKPIGIIACGAIVRELCQVMHRLQWAFELTAVPAQLHNRPEKIAPAVVQKLDAWAKQFEVILIGYADCGTKGALDTLAARYENVVRIDGAHCYEFFGGERFHEQAAERPGTFYLTDFLAHHFEGLVWKGLGLDRYPDLHSIYFAHYTDLLYLCQMADNDEEVRARAVAVKLDLRFEMAETGLDELERRVVSAVRQVQASRYRKGV